MCCPQWRSFVQQLPTRAVTKPALLQKALRSSARRRFGRFAAGAGGLWRERERSDPYPVRVDHDDAAGLESLLELRQVCLEERCLIAGSMLAAVAEEDDRRLGFLSRCEEGSPKSVSAETMTRSSSAARSKIASSEAACMPSSRTCVASCPRSASSWAMIGESALSIRNLNRQAATHARGRPRRHTEGPLGRQRPRGPGRRRAPHRCSVRPRSFRRRSRPGSAGLGCRNAVHLVGTNSYPRERHHGERTATRSRSRRTRGTSGPTLQTAPGLGGGRGRWRRLADVACASGE